MDITDVIAVAALIIQSVAFISWTIFVGKMDRKAYWTIWAALLLTGYNRINRAWIADPLFGAISSLMLSAVALYGVTQALAYIHRRAEAEARLKALRDKLQELQADSTLQQGVSTQLAACIASLRDELGFYETQAKDKGLPTFK